MPSDVRIPRSSRSRNEACYARLIARVFTRRPFWNAIEGKLLPCGARVERRELWPSPDYPAEPILLEYAGNDRSGRGHRRSNDLHVLWRYDTAAEDWVEIARFVSATGAELVESVRPILTRLLAEDRPPNPNAAPDASLRVIEALDYELEILDDRGARREMLGLLFDRFTARLVREEEAGSGSIGLVG